MSNSFKGLKYFNNYYVLIEPFAVSLRLSSKKGIYIESTKYDRVIDIRRRCIYRNISYYDVRKLYHNHHNNTFTKIEILDIIRKAETEKLSDKDFRTSLHYSKNFSKTNIPFLK